MQRQTWSTISRIALPLAVVLAGCYDAPGESELDDSTPVSTAESALVGCAGTGDVGAVTSAIAANCGGVAGCSNTTTTHNDLRLNNNNYCACYEWLWSQRNVAPFKNVQIFYHNAAAGQCGANFHIHVEKKTGNPACGTSCNGGMQGLWHMDLDTSPAESATLCTDTDSQIDRSYDCSCNPVENKQAGACVNPGGGGGGGTPFCSANCGGGGWWCANDGACIQNGVAGHNYHCPGNNAAPDVDQACGNGCVIAAAGSPDYCRPSGFCGGGQWCGNDCVGGFAKTLYNFSSSGAVLGVTQCQVGFANRTCSIAAAGSPDFCN